MSWIEDADEQQRGGRGQQSGHCTPLMRTPLMQESFDYNIQLVQSHGFKFVHVIGSILEMVNSGCLQLLQHSAERDVHKSISDTQRVLFSRRCNTQSESLETNTQNLAVVEIITDLPEDKTLTVYTGFGSLLEGKQGPRESPESLWYIISRLKTSKGIPTADIYIDHEIA
ncbi:hypothetical protein Tco_0862602 [Tanacetum coccineum]